MASGILVLSSLNKLVDIMDPAPLLITLVIQCYVDTKTQFHCLPLWTYRLCHMLQLVHKGSGLPLCEI